MCATRYLWQQRKMWQMLHWNDHPWQQDQVPLTITTYFSWYLTSVWCVNLSLFNLIISYEIVLANHVCTMLLPSHVPVAVVWKVLVWCYVLYFTSIMLGGLSRYVIFNGYSFHYKGIKFHLLNSGSLEINFVFRRTSELH